MNITSDHKRPYRSSSIGGWFPWGCFPGWATGVTSPIKQKELLVVNSLRFGKSYHIKGTNITSEFSKFGSKKKKAVSASPMEISAAIFTPGILSLVLSVLLQGGAATGKGRHYNLLLHVKSDSYI